ncbi:hypothetical protein [Streptomyces marincola]|uniref:Uncharacterized protein n=1 Tax=Streptomyces marincola TaxID=2878388 RepID=A0A1W7CSF9_9ACTN|nr:hypothetical protein [Streptomyces marincola]ARQ67753.1 hypothetical protein CAG99_01930 [Streptomyces marincola]
MTPVQVDWLTLLLGPLAAAMLLTALVAGRSAIKRGEPTPGWSKAVQGVGMIFVLSVAVINMAWGGQ